MANIKNKNELKRRIELFLDDELDYSINEDFCKETMKMMREFIGHASHRLDCEESRVKSLKKKLKEYEDLEEKGLLLRLPCKVGSTVYAICTCEAVGTVLDGTLYGSNGGFGTATGYYCPYELSDKCPHIDADDCDECKNIEAVFEDTIDYINITEYEVIIGLKNTNLCVTIDEIGKTVFLTKEEAEQKLKEMESESE